MKTEKKAAHTPGPWKVGESYYVLAGPEDGHLAACFNYVKGLGTVPQYANARLIAAAPELLEALKDVLKACGEQGLNVIETEEGGPDAEWAVRAEAVIAKAEGR